MRIGNEIVKIAADGARRHELRRDIQMGEFGMGLRQKPSLQFARERKITLQPAFLALDFFVEARVFQCDRNLRGQCRHGALVVLGEESAAGVLEIEHADNFVFVDQRNGQLGACFGVGLDVARILVDIRNQHCLLVLRRCADDAASERNLVFEVNVLIEAQRETVLKLLARRIEQQNAEHLVVDQAAHQFRDALKSSSRFRIEVSSRAISFSSRRMRACLVVRCKAAHSRFQPPCATQPE